MDLLFNPDFYMGLMGLGFAALIGLAVTKKIDLLNQTWVAVTISTMIALGYFSLVNHYMMDFQGLDYWFGMRK